jgi:hypothetical protein
MLGEILYEETGQTTGIRVLPSTGGETHLEVSLQTQGRIQGVDQRSMWTYTSTTRADGSIYGQGQGFMTTRDGDVINLLGSGAARSIGPDGSIQYRGAVYFHTASRKFASLNGTVGVHEYNVAADGKTDAKVWAWK